MNKNGFVTAIKIEPQFNFEPYLHWFNIEVQIEILNYKSHKSKVIAFTSALLKYYFLSSYLNVSTEAVVIKKNNYNRPCLHQPNHIDFNISHSGDYVVLIIGRHMRVGIDIEIIDPIIEYQSLTPAILSKTECSRVNNVDKFFILWTKKEALLKCIGCGFLNNKYMYTNLNCNYLEHYKPYLLTTKKFNNYYISVCVNDIKASPK